MCQVYNSQGSWSKVNTNTYSSAWIPFSQQPTIQGGPRSIVRAWSSFAWDSTREQLILWGGGHANYGGNEVYTWQSSTQQWTRGSLPSAIKQQPGVSNGFQTVDGPQNAPISAHTYDNQEYLPVADRFITFGGAAWNSGDDFLMPDSANVIRRTGPYLWDPSKADPHKAGGLDGSAVEATSPFNSLNIKAADTDSEGAAMWQNRNVALGFGTNFRFANGATDAVVEGGKDVVYVSTMRASNGTLADLWRYTINDVGNPAADTFVKVGAGDPGISGQGAGALDIARNLFVRTVGTRFVYWDLSGGGVAASHVFQPTIVGSGFGSLTTYGLEWDPERGWFVMWGGNGDVWYLKPPETMGVAGWELERAPAPTLSLTPHTSDASAFTGVLGKWKYIDEYDVFIGLVDDEEGDVWIYKPVEWAGLEADAPSIIAAPEPATLLLTLVGLGSLAIRRRRGPGSTP